MTDDELLKLVERYGAVREECGKLLAQIEAHTRILRILRGAEAEAEAEPEAAPRVASPGRRRRGRRPGTGLKEFLREWAKQKGVDAGDIELDEVRPFVVRQFPESTPQTLSATLYQLRKARNGTRAAGSTLAKN